MSITKNQAFAGRKNQKQPEKGDSINKTDQNKCLANSQAFFISFYGYIASILLAAAITLGAARVHHPGYALGFLADHPEKAVFF